MGKKALVALDTDHIKQYIFPTAKLEEIRGASSLLDRLNRSEMERIAGELDLRFLKVYANGGQGLFVIEEERAQEFCQRVQAEYRRQTQQGASITCVIQNLPPSFPDDNDKNKMLDAEIPEELALIRYHLQAAKLCPPGITALTSHPFMRLCEACGIRYAEGFDRWEPDAADRDRRYCLSCLEKRKEDGKIKKFIKRYLGSSTVKAEGIKSPLWERVLKLLQEENYAMPEETERPNDFDDFRQFPGAKDYMGLIYADGNGMGAKTEKFKTLREYQTFAETVDTAIDKAVSEAIQTWLPVYDPTGAKPLFQFDLLLLGGDDVLMVTPAPVALDVARTIAESFYKHANPQETRTEKQQANGNIPKKHALSIGVVLAPVAYSFGMLLDLAESTLNYAKKEGAKRGSRAAEAARMATSTAATDQAKAAEFSKYGDTFINFLVVAGSTSQDFATVYAGLQDKHGWLPEQKQEVKFCATLRPYTVEELDTMLKLIRDGKKLGLGRTKLHQAREAVLRMNLTSSVIDGLSVLRNWKTSQKNFVFQQIYTFAGRYQEHYRDDKRPETIFPRVIFPWFADGPATYRTSLLDFVELYDFVDEKAKNQQDQEGAGNAHENR